MKPRDRFYHFVVVFGLCLAFLFFHRTKYDTVDISHALEKAKDALKDNQEIVVFSSKNPFNFYDIINNLDDISAQSVYGVLTFPDQEKDAYPVVVGVAGSLGWGEHHYGYMDRYLNEGIAVFSLHSFKSRGVVSTVGKQVSVTIPMVCHDAYMALDALADRDDIIGDRIAITGWSLGGGVSLFTAWKTIKDILSPDRQFAALLPFYPPCVAEPDLLEITDAPLHILIGEIDNWVPAEPCVDMVNSLKMDGFDADITVYPGSHHSFDRDSDPVKVPHSYNLLDCRLTLSSSGVVRTKDYGFPMSNATLQKIGLYLCAERGATMGGNPKARDLSKSFSLQFMTEHLIK